MLVGVMSAPPAFQCEGVLNKVAEVCRTIDRLADPDDPQSSELLLLWACAGVCKLRALWRCTPASALERRVAVIDQKIRQTVRRIVVGDGGGFGPLQACLSGF